jgi:hypothetical protein
MTRRSILEPPLRPSLVAAMVRHALVVFFLAQSSFRESRSETLVR